MTELKQFEKLIDRLTGEHELSQADENLLDWAFQRIVDLGEINYQLQKEVDHYESILG